MYGPRDNDQTLEECAKLLRPLMLTLGTKCYLKWTCPECGERVSGTEPLTLNASGQVIFAPGYRHDEKADGSPCGRVVITTEYRFGCWLAQKL